MQLQQAKKKKNSCTSNNGKDEPIIIMLKGYLLHNSNQCTNWFKMAPKRIKKVSKLTTKGKITISSSQNSSSSNYF